jgi:cation transport regulator ChaB
MDWVQIITQAGLVVFKEGVNFIFSQYKDRREAEKEQKKEEEKAQNLAHLALEAEKVPNADGKLTEIHWNKVATLFWLSNDLMWIQDMMFRGALPERVLQGVNHAQQYCSDLGFDDKSFPIMQLQICKSILGSLEGIQKLTPELSVLLQQHYSSVNRYITSIKWYLNALLGGQEPGFEKLRAL